MIETIPVRRIVPTEKQYAWTFGGVDPIARVKPGEVLDLYTEDCFAGRIRSEKDLPSKSIEYPFKVPKRFLPSDMPWMNGVQQTMRTRAKAVMASRTAR